jgi:hypothetical protein
MKASFRHAAIAFVLAVGTGTASAETMITRESFKTLTIEQEDAIYAAVTEGIPEREAPVLGVGDELPWWAQVRTLPDSLQIKSATGLLYAVIPIRTAVGLHNDVFLVDPSTDKIIKIIRKPLTFRF